MAPTSETSRPTIAFFTPNPSSLATLDLNGELQAIQAELKALDRDVFRFLHQPATTPADLQRVLLDERPVAVQFSGHGRGGDGSSSPAGHDLGPTRTLTLDDDPDLAPTGIMLQGDGASQAKVVSGAALGQLFSTVGGSHVGGSRVGGSRVGGSIRLVVLNACHSVEQADALLEHVDFVVGVDGAIRDTAAKAFAVAFYRALASGRSVRVAFDLGVNALMLEGLATDVSRPVLRHREGADPRQFTLVDAPRAADGSLWDVFLSYAKNDREPTAKLARAIRDQGIRVYFDEWEEAAGDIPRLRINDAIEDAVHGLMAVSTTSMENRWIREQYAALLDKAVEEPGRLIPVIIGEGEVKLPPFLRIRSHVDLRGKTGDGYHQAIQAIADAIRRPSR